MSEGIILAGCVIFMISSTLSFKSFNDELSAKLCNGDDEAQQGMAEIDVLLLVLEECQEIFSRTPEVPGQLEGAVHICLERHRYLHEILEKIRVGRLASKNVFTRLAHGPRLVALEKQRKTAFDGFKHSVMLVRDLTFELRTDQRLVQMSTAMADFMTDDWNQGNIATHHLTPKTQPDKMSLMDKNIITDGRGLSKVAALQEMAKLINSNFTRDITIVLDTSTNIDPNGLKYIPARAKMDTGCDENIIALDVLKRADITKEQLDQLLVPVEMGQSIVFEGPEKATFSPKYQISFTWYQDRQPKSRKEKFYVVNDAPFDVNIGSKRFACDLRSPALILASRRKTKDERKAEHENRQRQLKEAEQLEQQQILKAQGERAQRPQVLVLPEPVVVAPEQRTSTAMRENGVRIKQLRAKRASGLSVLKISGKNTPRVLKSQIVGEPIALSSLD